MRGEPRQPQPIALEEVEHPEYEVDKILGSRLVKGGTQYLVRWKGYGAFDDTWEPATHLENASEKVKEFLARGPRGKRIEKSV